MFINILATLALVIFAVTVMAVMATATFTCEVNKLVINEHEGFGERA